MSKEHKTFSRRIISAGKQHFPKLLADLPNFSNITPAGQIEEILE